MISETWLQIGVMTSVAVIEGILAWRVYRLERSMSKTMQHFIDAKHFLGQIQEKLGDALDMLKKSKLRGSVETSFGKFEGSVELDKPATLIKEEAQSFFKRVE